MRRRGDRVEPQAPVYDPSALPADLAVCLETMAVVQRSATEDGPRAIVQIDGGGWIHCVEETTAQLLRRWPALTEAQLRRAVRHIGARVRQSATPLPTQRRSWVWDY
jgi:hypothetical protein